MSVQPNYRADGELVAEAIAQEARLKCTDPVYGEMVTEVIFKDELRPTVLFHEYMMALQSLAGVDYDEYFAHRSDQNYWEQALFEKLDEMDSLEDLTQGPY